LKLKQRKESAAFDSNVLANDQQLYPTAAITQCRYPQWSNLEAKRLLKADVDEGKPEYQVFPLGVLETHLPRGLLLQGEGL
jgi:hypothetical protein